MRVAIAVVVVVAFVVCADAVRKRCQNRSTFKKMVVKAPQIGALSEKAVSYCVGDLLELVRGCIYYPDAYALAHSPN